MSASIPTEEDYRVPATLIDPSVCIGRNLDGGEDRRWNPAIYRETQCGEPLVDGSDLCVKCTRRWTKYLEEPKESGPWTGRITEEPLYWVHMLGTAWAKGKKKLTFTSAAPVPAPEPPTLSVSEPAKAPEIALYKQLLAASVTENSQLKIRVAELEAKLAHIHASSA